MSTTKRITYKNIFLFPKEQSLLSLTNSGFPYKSASPSNIFHPTSISQRQ